MVDATRLDRLATALFIAATLALAVAWPGWRLADAPPAYAEAPAAFAARVDAFADGNAVVRPAPGDVPVLARRFEFFPALELQVGQTYRLHVSSVDGVHSLVLDGREVLLVPGQVRILEVTPERPGGLDLRCNEYCGLGHNRMRGDVLVVE